MKRCSCIHSHSQHSFQPEKYLTRDLNDGYLYIQVKYYIVHRNATSYLDKIEAQHNVIARDFNMSNSDINHVPKSGVYNFSYLRGNCKMRLVPFDIRNSDNIIYIANNTIPQSGFSNLDEIETFINQETQLNVPEANIMNIYVCDLKDNLLGQAELYSNHCVLNIKSIGGPDNPGDAYYNDYNIGRTATHELGHCFGLPHTFTDTQSCPSKPYVDDIPKQKNPNYDAFLHLSSSGHWDGKLDNAYRDCKAPDFNIPNVNPPYSCVASCQHGPYEMFMNFMDYANDHNAIMFTKKQVKLMRSFIIYGDVFVLQPGPEIPPDVPNSTVAETDVIPDNNSTNKTILIVMITILIIAIILISAVFAYIYFKKR